MSTHIVKNTAPFKSVIVNERKRKIPVDWEVKCVKDSFERYRKVNGQRGQGIRMGFMIFKISVVK